VKRILITCGETSSEQNASILIKTILSLDSSVEVLALGSGNLEKAGAEVIFRMENYAVMGFWEVFVHLGKFIRLERELKKIIRDGDIDLFIPVDYPGLNLRLADYAKKSGKPVIYFISPQVWAWGGWRMKRIRRSVDLMAVFFPFEEELYREHGVNVLSVKHPLIEMIDSPVEPKRLPVDGAIDVLLFPGSRRQEIERMFPVLLSAAERIKKRFPNVHFKVGLAPSIDYEMIEIPDNCRGYIEVTNRGIEELKGASLVIASSGTVTLQSAVSGTPMIVIYKTSWITYLLGRLLVNVDWIAMPNILAGGRIVPELIQSDAEPSKIADEAIRFLSDSDYYMETSRALLKLRGRLSEGRDIDDLATEALKMMQGA